MQPSDEEIMNLGVDDSGFRKLLSRWQLTGFIKSETGALYTPYFPLRNKITDVDVAFNMDSITVRNFNYNVGSSNFNLKGQLKNIRSNLMGRTRRPLDISMILKADTIDVNQLIKAAADGMTYSNNAVGLNTLGSEEELLSVESMEQQVMTETCYCRLGNGSIRCPSEHRSQSCFAKQQHHICRHGLEAIQRELAHPRRSDKLE